MQTNWEKRKRDHVTPLMKDLHWLPINFRIEFKIATLAYCAHHLKNSLEFRGLLNVYFQRKTKASSRNRSWKNGVIFKCIAWQNDLILANRVLGVIQFLFTKPIKASLKLGRNVSFGQDINQNYSHDVVSEKKKLSPAKLDFPLGQFVSKGAPILGQFVPGTVCVAT